MFYFGLKTFFMNKKYLLIMLLRLEFIVLIIFLIIVFLVRIFNYDFLIIIYFLAVMVCEAVIGLILLTLVVRCHGSDYIKSLFLILC